ncbi:MAG: GNAT family N-acetyltransferase [Armatimonadetes bacterium]|nr:GNAT family N-acetyltransferase [Armatimonadota bacterium]
MKHGNGASVDVREAVSQSDYDEARELVRAFHTWHKERHAGDIDLIDRYFQPGAFEDELANLHVKYGPPQGAMLVARTEGTAVGCVALRDLGQGDCEMKRMFVLPAHHGKGIGLSLAEAIVKTAKQTGYKRMLLDTSIRQQEAERLYARIGFVHCRPYYEMPDDVREWLVFMERRLV